MEKYGNLYRFEIKCYTSHFFFIEKRLLVTPVAAVDGN